MNMPVLAHPQQKRSEVSLEKILSAARRLIAIGGFDDAPITEIVREAGLSVGAFYARFKDKDALFHVIQSQTLDELQAFIEQRISEFEAAQLSKQQAVSIETIAQFAVDTLIDLYGRAPGLIRAIYMHTRIKQDPVLLERVKTFNAATIDRSRSLIDLVNKKKGDQSAYSAWASAIAVVGSFLREQILFGDAAPMPTKTQITKAKKVAQSMLTAYMRDQLDNQHE